MFTNTYTISLIAIITTLLIIMFLIVKHNLPKSDSFNTSITDAGVYDSLRKNWYYSPWMLRYPGRSVTVVKFSVHTGQVLVFGYKDNTFLGTASKLPPHNFVNSKKSSGGIKNTNATNAQRTQHSNR
jgi:hypothetical protein